MLKLFPQEKETFIGKIFVSEMYSVISLFFLNRSAVDGIEHLSHLSINAISHTQGNNLVLH